MNEPPKQEDDLMTNSREVLPFTAWELALLQRLVRKYAESAEPEPFAQEAANVFAARLEEADPIKIIMHSRP